MAQRDKRCGSDKEGEKCNKAIGWMGRGGTTVKAPKKKRESPAQSLSPDPPWMRLKAGLQAPGQVSQSFSKLGVGQALTQAPLGMG